jgi:hypothetical protein
MSLPITVSAVSEIAGAVACASMADPEFAGPGLTQAVTAATAATTARPPSALRIGDSVAPGSSG